MHHSVYSVKLPAEARMPGKGTTVLVVDDEPEVRKLVCSMLARQGYRVLSADTGENAVRLLHTNPDTKLLLTDVVSPGMSGPMIADEMAAVKPEIKVLFMSGFGGTQVVQRYVVEKGYSLLVKPFTVEQLQRKVLAVLKGERDTQAED